MNSSLDLIFVDNWKITTPTPQIANIYVKTYTSDNGRIFITPDCVHIQEFEYEINRLHKELDNILKKAKRKFQKPHTNNKG